MVDALPAHVAPLPSSCVQVIVTGTTPDWSEKKIRPDGPALMSPWGRITVNAGRHREPDAAIVRQRVAEIRRQLERVGRISRVL
jgi:hypothetical protein